MSTGLTSSLLSPEIGSVLERHGISAEPVVLLFEADAARAPLASLLPPESLLVPGSVEELVSAVRRHRISGILMGAGVAPRALEALARAHQTVGVIVCDRVDEPAAAALRSQGVMEIVPDPERAPWPPLLRRLVDYRALVILELQHRCEAKRLSERELELLGQPPESMSDDLTTNIPPPLPVGPMSTYNLEEASESFETAYIDRVQQLCASAREAAEYLGVSSATLSRRLRREAASGA